MGRGVRGRACGARWLASAVAIVVAAATLVVAGPATPATANETRWVEGDVFVGISDGLVRRYAADGTHLETYDTSRAGVSTTGCAFDAGGDLYVTTFDGGDVVRFAGPEPPHTNRGTFGGSYSGNPESIVFDSVGNVYVGAVDGDGDIRKFDPDGNLEKQFDVEIEDRGSDWIDLAADQRTMFYTSEGSRILRYDLATDQQLPDFASGLPGTAAYALRLLSGGGLLVADTSAVLRLDATGAIVETYDVPGEDSWFSLNLDPDGESFWAGNFDTGRFYKFDIEVGGSPLLTVDTGVGALRLFGICIYQEKTSALSDADGDGLLDDWEENGFDFDGDGNVDVDLPGMGARKDHKDVFVHVDWLGTGGLFSHDHRPSDEAIDKVVRAFANAPVPNPDGDEGINLHVVFGRQITEDDANREVGSVIGDCTYNWQELDELKLVNFPAERWPVFHYALFAHDMPTFPCINGRPSGISRNTSSAFDEGASDFIVALGGWQILFLEGSKGSTNANAGTFMHELGHNLGLGHGGVVKGGDGTVVASEHTNHKPNHLSIMNYSFTTRGLTKQDAAGIYRDGHMDYSRFGPGDLPDLRETALVEANGLGASDAARGYGTRYYCAGNHRLRTVRGLQQAVNWNCRGGDNEATSTDVNKDNRTTTLTTADEWNSLMYRGGAVGTFGVAPELPMTTSTMEISPEITLEQDLELGPLGVPHTVGLVDPTQGRWHLRDQDGDVSTFFFGDPGDTPFMGDWDCDGVETPGLYRRSDGFAYLRNSNTSGIAHIRFFFGDPGDLPLAGDFDGDGCDTLSIYRPSEGRFYIINELGANDAGLGAADVDYLFGNPGDKPFVGDFDDDGVETVGLHRESTGLVYFRNSHTQGIANAQFVFGDPGDRLVAGDWRDRGVSAPGLFRPSEARFYLRFSNTQGVADSQFAFGEPGWLPVAGLLNLG